MNRETKGAAAVAVGTGIAFAALAGTFAAAGSSPAVTARAVCSGYAVQIIYTAPRQPGLLVSTTFDRHALFSFVETSADDGTFVTGLPSGDHGKDAFSVTAAGQSATVVLPTCALKRL